LAYLFIGLKLDFHFCYANPVGAQLAYLFIGLKLTRLGMPFRNAISDRLVHRWNICLSD